MIVGAHIIDNKPIMYNPWGRIINDGIGIHGCRAHTIDNKLIMYNPWGRIINDGIGIHGCRGAHHRQQTNYV
jgi:hypothetical protein